MKHLRQHKRYDLHLIDISGKLSCEVEILDIGFGGIALKADRRLDLGSEYFITMQDKGKTLKVAAIVVRSELCAMEPRRNGTCVAIYLAGMKFKEGSADAVAAFLESVADENQ